MFRIDSPQATGLLPTPAAAGTPGYFTEGNPATNTPATPISADWLNMVQEELAAVATGAGLTLDKTNNGQILLAIQALITAQASAGVAGTARALKANANGTSAAVTVTADEIVLENASNQYLVARSVSLSVSGASSGANGLDTGALAGNTWYALWVIAKADGTVAGLLSTSATAPTMPAGYTFKARIGWIRTDGTGNKYPLAFKQTGRKVRYVVAAGTNVTAAPTIATGTSGTLGTTLTAVSLASLIPSTAVSVFGAAYQSSTGNLTIGVQVSPNSNPAATGGAGVYLYQSINTTNCNQQVQFDFVLESTNIYYAGLTSGGGSVGAVVIGWEDAI